jgi:hypothetical protein
MQRGGASRQNASIVNSQLHLACKVKSNDTTTIVSPFRSPWHPAGFASMTKPVSSASLPRVTAPAEAMMLALPTYRALLSTLEGKASKLTMNEKILFLLG